MSQMAPENQPVTEEDFINAVPDDSEFTRAGVDAAQEATPRDQAAQPDETAAHSAQEGTTQEDSLELPQELQSLLESIQDPAARAAVEQIERGFKGAYTRKTQELAEQRKALGDLDPALAQEAVEFYTNLQEDPAFALEVHEYLTNAFQAMGLTREQAETAAADEVAQRQTPVDDSRIPDADEDPDSYLKSQVDHLNQRLATFEERERIRIAAEEEENLAANFLNQEMALMRQNPKLSEEDMDYIYDIAPSVGYNLFEAHNRLKARDEAILQRYLAEKGAVPDVMDEPTPRPVQEVPDVPRLPDGSPDLEAVHRVAMQRLFNHMSER